jgi:hypothetical protein
MAMQLRRTLALAGAMTVMVFAACKEPPFAPRWDADWYLPLSTQPIHLNTFFPVAIPPTTSGSVSFPAQQQDISGVLGDVLKNVVTDPSRCTSKVNPALSCDLLTLKIEKNTAVAANDTLFVANAQAGLNAGTAATVVFPVSLATTDLSKTDTLYLTQASVQMLQAAGQSGTPLWVQLRGQVSNPGASPITITSADSLGITLAVTVRIAVSHK